MCAKRAGMCMCPVDHPFVAQLLSAPVKTACFDLELSYLQKKKWNFELEFKRVGGTGTRNYQHGSIHSGTTQYIESIESM